MGANTLRIIGGRWRRQLLEFPDIPELRPTQDRIRETLFNWLTPYIKGASCLDLFAGSGALGFEALSRGARKVTFVDRNSTVIRYIKKTAQTFKIPSEDIEIIQGSCLEKELSLSFYPYDIIFLDPPFRDKRLPEFIAWLESNAYLNPSALIYVETERQKEPLSLFNWSMLKEGHTTNVSYYLYQR